MNFKRLLSIFCGPRFLRSPFKNKLKLKHLNSYNKKIVELKTVYLSADYLFVVGHYPIASDGKYGMNAMHVNECLWKGVTIEGQTFEGLESLFRKYHVNAYFSGTVICFIFSLPNKSKKHQIKNILAYLFNCGA